MKILHVIANLAPRYGGPTKACLETARAQARLGNEVYIYTTNQDGNTELTVNTDRVARWSNVDIRYFPIQHPKFWGTSIPLGRALKEKIRHMDVIHIHSLYLYHTAVAGLYSDELNTPYVICPHGALDPCIYKRHRFRKNIVEILFQNRVIQRASGIHFITEEEMNLSKDHINKTPGFVVPFGLDIEEYASKPSIEKLFIRFPELIGKKIILFLGRINFVKGLDILVSAFSIVARERNDVHLLIAGPNDNSYVNNVIKWLIKENIYNRATIAGFLQGEEKLEALHCSSIFVLPSYSENFGLSVLEAMACGLPVIVSEKVNLWPEIVAATAGEVAPCNAEIFSRKILYILNNECLARQMGLNGVSLVKNSFSCNDTAIKLLNIYSSIIMQRHEKC